MMSNTNKILIRCACVAFLIIVTIMGWFLYPFFAWLIGKSDMLNWFPPVAQGVITLLAYILFMYTIENKKRLRGIILFPIFVGLFFALPEFAHFVRFGGNAYFVGNDYIRGDGHLFNQFGIRLISDYNNRYEVGSSEYGVPIIVGVKVSGDGFWWSSYDDDDDCSTFEFKYYDESGEFIDNRTIKVGRISSEDVSDCDIYVEDDPYEAAKQLVRDLDGISM